MHHNATLPHELMAAMQELSSKPKPKGDGGRVAAAGTGAGDGVDPKFKKSRRTCPTWNKSEKRGKCTFEMEHPSLKCRYTHECSWCS